MTPRPNWLPDETQEHLLQAATAPEAATAANAWNRWNDLTTLDDVQTQSFNLLPLVYRNLTNLGVNGQDIDRLRGVYRYTWSRNQLLMSTGARAIRTLNRGAIETLVLKGGALNLLQFNDLGVRPMADFDLLVPREAAREAISLLLGNGFRERPDYPGPELRLTVHHSAPMRDEDGRELDLHWYSLWQSAPDDEFWEAALPIRIGDEATVALCPTDQLLHVIAHGTYWDRTTAIGWVADAAKIVRGAREEVHWDRFTDEARRRGLAGSVCAPLSYLRERFGVPVPLGVLTDLRRGRTDLLGKAAARTDRNETNRMRVLLMLFDRYRRLRRFDPAAPRPSSFPAYVARWFGYDSTLSFSLDAGKRLVGIRRS